MVRPCSVSRKPRVHIRVGRHVIISTSHRTRAPILRHEIHTACIGTVLPRREQRRAHHKGNALYYYVDIVCKFNWTDCIASFSLRTPPRNLRHVSSCITYFYIRVRPPSVFLFLDTSVRVLLTT